MLANYMRVMPLEALKNLHIIENKHTTSNKMLLLLITKDLQGHTKQE